MLNTGKILSEYLENQGCHDSRTPQLITWDSVFFNKKQNCRGKRLNTFYFLTIDSNWISPKVLTIWPPGSERIYLPLYRVTDTPFYIITDHRGQIIRITSELFHRGVIHHIIMIIEIMTIVHFAQKCIWGNLTNQCKIDCVRHATRGLGCRESRVLVSFISIFRAWSRWCL